jgi:hypothetical protein
MPLQFPLQDDAAALKAFALAQRHGLTGAAAGLARRLGMAAAAGSRSAAALQWFMRAHDPAKCAKLVAPLLLKVQQQLLDQVGLRLNAVCADVRHPCLNDLVTQQTAAPSFPTLSVSTCVVLGSANNPGHFRACLSHSAGSRG